MGGTAAAVYLDIAVKLPPQAWPFDFPGAHAIARCAATEEGRTKLLRSRSSAEVLQVVEEAESKLLRRHCRDGTASSRAASRFREVRGCDRLGGRRVRHGGARVCHKRAPDA